MVTLTASAHCNACEWRTEGDPETVDKASEKHTKATGHGTGVMAAPRG